MARATTLAQEQHVRYLFGACELDPSKLELRVGGECAQVSRAALLLLVHLVRARGEQVRRSELLTVGWSDTTVSEASVRQAICELRRALRADPSTRHCLQTVRAEGYRFVASVEERALTEPGPRACDARAEGLVGRVRELDMLGAAWRRARAGQGKTVVLSGAPGTGKTRLARELASLASKQGALVLHAHAKSEHGAPALWPFRQLVSRCLDACADDLRSRCEQIAPHALRCLLSPLSASRPPALRETPQQERFLLFEELAQLFVVCAGRSPVCVVLDDLHAADELSQAFFARLAGETTTSRIFLLATSRPLEAREQRPLSRLLDALDYDRAPERLSLGNLSVAELAELCELRSSRPPPPETVARIYELTRGNPLFSLEVLRWLESERALEWLPAGTVDLLEIIRRRLARLPERVQDVLSAAAVLGEEFETAALCGASGQSSSELRSAVREALVAEVLAGTSAEGRYQFAHPLLREAASCMLDEEQRCAVHERIVTWIEGRGQAAIALRMQALAHHAYQVRSEVIAPRAASYLTIAADCAYQTTAFGEAATLYERALEMIDLAREPDPRSTLELKLKLGDALRADGASSERLNALFVEASEQASALGEPELVARAALGYAGQGPERFTLARVPQAIDPVERELLTRALQVLGDGHPELRALLLSALSFALLYAFDAEARWSYIEEATAIARATENAALLARVLSVRVLVAAAPPHARTQRATCDELVSVTAGLVPRRAHVEALVMRALSLIARGAPELAEADFRRAERLAADLGCSEAQGQASLGALFRSFCAGQLAEVEQQAAQLFSAARDPLRARIAFAVRMLGVQLLRCGETQNRSALDALATAAFADSAVPRCMQVAGHAERGERTAAVREFDRLAADDFAALPESPTWLCEMAMLGAAACVLDDPHRARRVYRRLRPFAEHVIVYGWDALPGGPVASELGMLATTMGEFADAERWFERGLAVCSEFDAPLFELATKCEYARLLERRGTREDLRKLRAFSRELSAFGRAHDIGVFQARAFECERALAQRAALPALKAGS